MNDGRTTQPINLFREFEAIAIATPVAKGSFIFSSGDPASAIYVVRSGKIALIWANSHELYPMDTFGPGRILGLPAAFNGEYSATARAVVDSELGFIPATRAMEMLKRNPTHMQLALKLLALDVARMREMIGEAPRGNRLHAVEKSSA
jgi:CRP-like cAMP-binding protein